MNKSFSVKRTILMLPLLAFIAMAVFAINTDKVNAAAVAEGECGENAVWVLDDQGILTISGQGPMDNYLNKNNVPWLDYKTNDITGIVVDEGITSVGYYAFYECKSAASVALADSVTEIYPYAFGDCSSLVEVALPANLEKIRGRSFQRCDSLKTITIPSKVSIIDNEAFYDCRSLESVVLQCAPPADLVRDAFGDYCGPVYYPTNYDLWDEERQGAFAPKAVWVANGETEEYTLAGGSCGDDAEWTVSNLGVLRISGQGDMYDNGSYTHNPWADYMQFLRAVIIEEGITSIGGCACQLSTNLYKAVIPESVTVIGVAAFSNTRIKEISLPDNIVEIGTGAFGRCEQLKSIKLPRSLKTLGAHAFIYCTSLESVVLPEGLEVIQSETFRSCNALEGIALPSTIGEIGASAFKDCRRIESLTIPENVYSIQDGIVDGCSKLETITFQFPAPIAAVNALRSFAGTVYYPSNGGWDENTRNAWAPDAEWIAKGEVERKTVDHGTCGDTAQWSVDNLGMLVISGAGAMDEYSNETHAPWKKYADRIREASVENGITNIGAYAFYQCGKITTINIPDSIVGIGAYAFNSTDIRELTVPDAVAEIGKSAFGSCHSLKTITLGNGLSTINENLFSSCSSLETIRIPEGIKLIDREAFLNCGSLESVELPNTLETIKSYAFKDCSGLSELTIPQNVTTIGESIIKGCDHLNSITLKCHLFNANTGRSFISFTGTIYYPKNDLLYGDEETKQTIAPNATWVADDSIELDVRTVASGQCGENAAWELNNIGELTISGTGPMDDYSSGSDDIPWKAYRYGNLLKITVGNGITRVGTYAFSYAGEVRALELAESVEEIGNLAFYGCGKLKTVTIPGSVTRIEAYAFQSCGLEKVVVQEGVTQIGFGMFRYCSQLSEVVLPGTIEVIDANAFDECSALATITIPKKVRSIESGAFTNCPNLESVHFKCFLPATVTNALKEYTGTIYYPCNDDFCDEETQNAWAPNATWIPEGEAEMIEIAGGACGEHAAWSLSSHGVLTISGTGKMYDYGTKSGSQTPWDRYRSSIRKIVVEEGITRVGSYTWSNGIAIAGQQNPLKKVVIADTVTEIGDTAFYGAVDLKELTLPDGIRKIEKNAFCWLGIRQLVIPGSVETIDHSAFAYCKQLEKVTLGSGITALGSWMFGECSNLEEVTLPKTVKRIGYSAFHKCDSLKEIQLPDSLAIIDSGAFSDCSSLAKIVFSSKNTDIGDRAFSGCYNLAIIIFKGTAPKPLTGYADNTFLNFNGTVYYPAEDTTWTEEKRKAWAPNATWKNGSTITYNAAGDTTVVDGGKKTTTTISDKEVQTVVEEVMTVKPKKVLVKAKPAGGTSKVKTCTTQIPASLARAAANAGAVFTADTVVGAIELDKATVRAAVPQDAVSINLNIRNNGVSSDKLTLDHTVEFRTKGTGEPVYNIDLAGEAKITVPTPPGALESDVIEAAWIGDETGVQADAAVQADATVQAMDVNGTGNMKALSVTRTGNKVNIRTNTMGRIESTSNNAKNIKVTASNLVYNGKTRAPSGVKVKVSSKVLTRGTDYSVVTKKVAKSVGKKTVTVKCSRRYNYKKASGKFYINPKKPGKPKVTAGKGSIKVTIDKFSVTGASKYEIKYKVAGTNSWKKIKKSSNTVTIKKLKKGKKYSVKVKAVKDGRSSSFSKTGTSGKVK